MKSDEVAIIVRDICIYVLMVVIGLIVFIPTIISFIGVNLIRFLDDECICGVMDWDKIFKINS